MKTGGKKGPTGRLGQRPMVCSIIPTVPLLAWFYSDVRGRTGCRDSQLLPTEGNACSFRFLNLRNSCLPRIHSAATLTDPKFAPRPLWSLYRMRLSFPLHAISWNYIAWEIPRYSSSEDSRAQSSLFPFSCALGI
jgi:hypothetical protein